MDSSASFELVVWSAIFLYVIHIILQYSLNTYKRTVIPQKYVSGAAKSYFVFAIIALLSSIYSIRPLYTFYFAMKFFSIFVLCFYIAERNQNDPWILLKVLFVTFGILFFVKVLNYLYNPAFVGVTMRNGQYRLTGGWLGGYGVYAAYTALGCMLLYFTKPLKNKRKFFLFILLLVSMYFVYLAKTRQIFVFILVTAIPLFFLTKKFKFTKYNVVYLVILMFMGIYALGIVEEFALVFVRDFNSIQTLSGRTVILAAFLENWHAYFPFGDGFQAGSRYWLIRLGFAKIGLGAAHDSISKVAVELGIAGIVLLFFTLILAWRQYWQVLSHAMLRWKNDPGKIKYFVLTIFLGGNIFYLTATLVTSSSFASGSFYAVIYLITLQMLNRQRRLEKIGHYGKTNTSNISGNPLIQPGKVY